MDRGKLKTYAPAARRELIAAVTARAALFGLTEKEISPVLEQGDVALIEGRPYPRAAAARRARLEQRLRREGFAQVMEAMAYTWFNRLVAIRFMELHGFLEHGYRVLSHPGGKDAPEILEQAEHVDLPGLDRAKVIELKLDGTKDAELYRLLLLAQCNALSAAMPFLFARIDDETELLLPDNLLHSDSVVRELVSALPEQDWQQVEILGWLYQFYISEKKAEVIGKVVKSEDIPAATQLFTPNWIVKYLVQNSLGRQWLATYPDSPLRSKMEFYIEPAEQTPEVQAQLAEITPASLDPEELTLLDPACGSGHILVEAYELLKAIYQERGYRARDIPRLILTKNLFGLEIDDRAAQLASFALLMKARADDRRIFEPRDGLPPVQPQVVSLQDSQGMDPDEICAALDSDIVSLTLHGTGEVATPPREPKSRFWELAFAGPRFDLPSADAGASSAPSEPIHASDIVELVALLEHAKTFGSLIQIPESLAAKLPEMRRQTQPRGHDLFASAALAQFGVLVRQAELLARKYDAVVANPPYMGSKYYCPALKKFINESYEAGKADTYSAFCLRNMSLVKDGGRIGMITIPNWMFLSSFEQLRKILLEQSPIESLAHNGRGVWGSDFGSCSFILQRTKLPQLRGVFLRLFSKQGSIASNEELESRFHTNERFSSSSDDFRKIPGNPIAYWLSDRVRAIFEKGTTFSLFLDIRQGMSTGDTPKWVREWHEIRFHDLDRACLNSDDLMNSRKKWFPYSKGGEFRKWFGNNRNVIDFENNGSGMKIDFKTGVNRGFRMVSSDFFCRPGLTWTDISSSMLGARFQESGFLFENTGSMAFAREISAEIGLTLLCSKLSAYFMQILNPTLHFSVGEIRKIPILNDLTLNSRLLNNGCSLIAMGKDDWDAYERSWDFRGLPLLCVKGNGAVSTVQASYDAWVARNREVIAEMKRLEEENNRLFIDAYGLQDELSPEVPLEQITLTVNPAYRYGKGLTEEEGWARFREDSMKELVSYAVGCMMGRYSLDRPGLVYAHSGGEAFDPSQYQTFPADADGILPLTEQAWFEDDVAVRLERFIATAWPAEGLEGNLRFLAEGLGQKKGESPRDTLRRYLAASGTGGFYKHHLQTYKNRPIYWLFSSGKQRAFQCLVYLHRYNEGTLSRMRTEYVIPLQGKIASRLAQLDLDLAAASSTAHRKKLEKERDGLLKQRSELLSFDEKLRHHADLRIRLDLDDGVRANYGKFGGLLAEVKTVTGGSND
jgi:hypothetical protein